MGNGKAHELGKQARTQRPDAGPDAHPPHLLLQALATIVCLPLAFAIWSAWEAFSAGQLAAAMVSGSVAVAALSLAAYLFVPARNHGQDRR